MMGTDGDIGIIPMAIEEIFDFIESVCGRQRGNRQSHLHSRRATASS